VRFEPNTFTISPDKRWFVYFQENNNEIVLYLGNVENNNQRALYWDNRWDEIVFWLNNDKLFVPPGPNHQSSIALNPFTGDWEELPSEFPSGLNFSFPYFYYNSTLSSVIYISGDNYILWDKKSNKDIWIKPTLAAYLAPKWSPDGGRAALVVRDQNNGLVRDELVLVNQDGKETDLSRFLQEIQGNLTIQITAVEWSPNNQYLALSLEFKNALDNLLDSTLIIVDSFTGQAADFCVPLANNIIVWSPNSGKLAVEAFGQNKKDTSLYLIDIEQGWAAEIDKNLTPLGWMITP
ncbi:MAG TPA: hypothetical protein VJM08_11860, partial [Anaerolineales bacterium]|nr:hypothetical protein [Anaerolineales bacterium]